MTKTELQGNNLDLRTILNMVNNLPNKGSGTGEDISEELTAQDALISEISLALDEVAVAQADAFAAIGVTYSEGSTCTCSCGDITLTAKDTSGQVLFLVPNAGEWIVMANNKSKSINITKEGQLESINLASLYLIENKKPLIGFTEMSPAGGKVTIGDTITFSSGEQAIRSRDKIDCTDYTKLIAEVNVTGMQYDYPLNVVVSDDNTSYHAYIQLNPATAPSPVLAYAQKRPLENNWLNVVEVDITDITGSHYVGIGVGYISGSTVENFWLE